MKIESINLLTEVERLGAGFPWEEVQLTISRKPNGEASFSCYVTGDSDKGLLAIITFGQTPTEAVDGALAKKNSHDPEICRAKLVADLETKLIKIKAVKFDFPPYRPNRELASGTLTTPDTIEV